MVYYLIGGGDIKAGKLKEIDGAAIAKSQNKEICVVDLTSNDQAKIKNYREFLNYYFKALGADNITFISKLNSKKDFESRLTEAGLVYIPGGNTELLLKNIDLRGIGPVLKGLTGVVVGNSAGALVMCNEVILTKDEDTKETKVLPGLSLVNFAVDVHYEESHDAELFELSDRRAIYAIPENCAIVFDEKLSCIGSVYRFSKGIKEKIN